MGKTGPRLWVTPALRDMSPECHQARFRPRGQAGQGHIRLAPGVAATLVDLDLHFEYEGKQVLLGDWAGERAKWRATLLDGSRRTIRVAPWNLEAMQPPPEGGWRAGDAAILEGLATQRSLNGQRVSLMGGQLPGGKWRVHCKGVTVTVATEKLRRPPDQGALIGRGFSQVPLAPPREG